MPPQVSEIFERVRNNADIMRRILEEHLFQTHFSSGASHSVPGAAGTFAMQAGGVDGAAAAKPSDQVIITHHENTNKCEKMVKSLII